MDWVRVNRRFGAWAALFALAVQITLSFGHVHLDGVTPSRAAAQTQAQSADGAPAPGGQHHSGGQDYCAICATLGLIASSVLPDPAGLILPIAHLHPWSSHFPTAPAMRWAHDHFQARAPPFFG
jgi:hypothetical protein